MSINLSAVIVTLSSALAQQCANPPAAPALDHAIIAVRDIEAASTAFRRAGFRIKPGRPHANGLLNRHIKFRDGSEVELMTVQGEPRDAMARDYSDLIKVGGGGVYVALKVRDLADAKRASVAASLETLSPTSGAWQFLSYPPSSAAAAVFFSSGGVAVQDADSIFAHSPPVSALAEVWVEGGTQLSSLLRGLGAVSCGRSAYEDGRSGERWMLSRGSIVVLPVRTGVRPRVVGVVLESPGPEASRQVLPDFWVRYR